MSWRRGIVIVIALLSFSGLGAAQAQGGAPKVAFVNSSGQLVVASGDGAYRWIVTNPGEQLDSRLGFTWSPDGSRLFLAVNMGASISLRIGDIASMTATEIGQVSGVVTGGGWSSTSTVVLGVQNSIVEYNVSGGTRNLAAVSDVAWLNSPFANDRPNLPAPRSTMDGYVFFSHSSIYSLYNPSTGSTTDLPGTNDSQARSSGLWSSSGDLVAYWSLANDGTTMLSVTGAASGNTITLASGRSAPIVPLAWNPGTTQLIYRDTTNFIRIADVGCVNTGCGANPLESGTALLPAAASDVQVAGGWAFWRDGENIVGVSLTCVASQSCENSAVTLGQQSAPQTMMHAAGQALVYTAYNQDARNPNDREVRVINLGCLGDPSTCQPQTLVSGAVAGLVSDDGQYVVADVTGSGLNIIRIADGAATYLSGSANGQLGTGLVAARWD